MTPRYLPNIILGILCMTATPALLAGDFDIMAEQAQFNDHLEQIKKIIQKLNAAGWTSAALGWLGRLEKTTTELTKSLKITVKAAQQAAGKKAPTYAASGIAGARTGRPTPTTTRAFAPSNAAARPRTAALPPKSATPARGAVGKTPAPFSAGRPYSAKASPFAKATTADRPTGRPTTYKGTPLRSTPLTSKTATPERKMPAPTRGGFTPSTAATRPGVGAGRGAPTFKKTTAKTAGKVFNPAATQALLKALAFEAGGEEETAAQTKEREIQEAQYAAEARKAGMDPLEFGRKLAGESSAQEGREASAAGFSTVEEFRKKQKLDVVRKAIANGADVNACSTGWSPLKRAIVRHDGLEMVKFLVSAGARVNEDCGNGESPLYYAIASPTGIASYLRSQGASMSSKMQKLLEEERDEALAAVTLNITLTAAQQKELKKALNTLPLEEQFAILHGDDARAKTLDLIGLEADEEAK